MTFGAHNLEFQRGFIMLFESVHAESTIKIRRPFWPVGVSESFVPPTGGIPPVEVPSPAPHAYKCSFVLALDWKPCQKFRPYHYKLTSGPKILARSSGPASESSSPASYKFWPCLLQALGPWSGPLSPWPLVQPLGPLALGPASWALCTWAGPLSPWPLVRPLEPLALGPAS